jgi:hypothetical protein
LISIVVSIKRTGADPHGARQGQGVLGKAGAAVAWAGVQKLRADPVVETDASGNLLHVRSDLFAQVGHLVDEGDLHGEKGVGGILDQLGRAPAGEQDRRLVEAQRAIQLGHHRARAVVGETDDDTVGTLEILDRRTFAKEFGVGDHRDLGVRPGATDDRLDLVARPHRHRGFGDQDGEAGHEARDLFGGGVDVTQVGIAVAAARRRTHRDEDRVRLGHRRLGIGREEQPPLGDVAFDDRIETRLIDRHHAGLQPLDLSLVLVDARDDVSELGETHTRDQADVSRPNHHDSHGSRYLLTIPGPAKGGRLEAWIAAWNSTRRWRRRFTVLPRRATPRGRYM